LLLGLGQPSLVWVWVWKISPKNTKNFNFFSSDQKKISLGWVKNTQVKGRSASYLLPGKSILGLGWVRLGQDPPLTFCHVV